MLYASFNVIAQVELVWKLYAAIWICIFGIRIAFKEYSLSRKDGWIEYKQRSWMILPKIFTQSDLLTSIFYAFFILLSYFVYSNGGIEVTLKSLKASYFPNFKP
jgi:hypothetical protein